MMNTLNRYKEKIMNTINGYKEKIMNNTLIPKVCIFVGFVSAAIGLICFAFSSSFKHLFGDWNSLKIFLYFLVSFIIIILLIILFANKWKLSTRLWFKVSANVLVLTLTSFYSYYLEEKLRGKPDAYSLISYAAFSIMSLSLLLQNQCGFGKELMEFFVGCFIVQFMKIKLIFFIPGACFYYIILGVCLSRRNRNDAIEAAPHSNINVIVDRPLTQLTSATDNEESISLLDSNIGISSMREKLGDYVKALQQEHSTHMEILMEKLKDNRSDDSGFNVSEDIDFMIMALPTETIDNIHKTAKLMVSAGFKKEFSEAYSSFRRKCLVKSLPRLGFKKLSIEDLQMLSWEEIKLVIVRWIKASNLALNILLPVERKLCDRVLFGFSSTADSSFKDICSKFTLKLLNFVDVIAIGSGSPERLLTALEVFDTMRDLVIPELKSLFRDQYSGSLQNEVTTICKRLGAAIRDIFTELGNLIQGNSTEIVDASRVTSYVMNYIYAASASRKTLEEVFEGDYPLKDRVHSSSDLSVQMGFIIELLQNKLIDNLPKNARMLIRVSSLRDNCDYVVQTAKKSELGLRSYFRR